MALIHIYIYIYICVCVCVCVCAENEMGKLSQFHIINYVLAFSGFINCSTNKNQLVTVSEKSNTVMQFTPPEIWKRHAALTGIHNGSSNAKVSSVLGYQSEDRAEDSKIQAQW